MDAITTCLQQLGRGYAVEDKEVESSNWRRMLREAGVDPEEAFEKVVTDLIVLMEGEDTGQKIDT